MIQTAALPDSASLGLGPDPGNEGSRRPSRLLKLAAAVPLAALLGGCATYLSTQVTSFHQMAPDHRLAGRSFVIEPTPEQQVSLEFRAYADLVRNALIRQGLSSAPGSDAELGVTLRYSIDSGKAVTYGYPAYGYSAFAPVWGLSPYYGYGGVHYAWTAAYPMGYGVVGTHYTQSMLYRRELRAEITERRADGKGARLFEGSVVSEGESASLAPVMPAMVQALFSDFPGPNGVSRRVHVRLDDAPPGSPAPVQGSSP